MSSNALAAVQDLDAVACDPSFDLLTNEAMGDAVIMSVDFDVVIDVFCGRPQKTSCVAKRFLWPWR